METCSRLAVRVSEIDGFSYHRPWHCYTIHPRQKITSTENIPEKNLLKLMSRGIPKASAQWTCANVGGFEIMASAAKVRPVLRHGE